MKKAVASKKINWEAVCEETRQRCNKLSDEARHSLREKCRPVIFALSK